MNERDLKILFSQELQIGPDISSDSAEWVECRGKWTGEAPAGRALAYFSMPDWEPEHLHWNQSSLYFHDSGDAYFLAKRLSNQRRTGLLDSGRRWFATVEFHFKKLQEDEKPFYAYEIAVCRLDWKSRVDCYERIISIPALVPYFKNCDVTLTRHWRTDSTETPPVVVPFPPISFP